MIFTISQQIKTTVKYLHIAVRVAKEIQTRPMLAKIRHKCLPVDFLSAE